MLEWKGKVKGAGRGRAGRGGEKLREAKAAAFPRPATSLLPPTANPNPKVSQAPGGWMTSAAAAAGGGEEEGEERGKAALLVPLF